MSFPNEYVESVTPLEPSIGQRGDTALARLNEHGYIVATGLTPYFAGAIALMGQQPHIREYCPRDATAARFGTQESTRLWLEKNGGRATFLLLSQVEHKGNPMGLQLEGYAWTGLEPCEALPDYPITSAYRLGETALGKHLSGDFVQVVVSGTHTLYADGKKIGLETWDSNPAASLYPKVGFVPAEQPHRLLELRPTLDSKAENGMTMDTRLFMGYPAELLVA
jgi:hypothetical protein